MIDIFISMIFSTETLFWLAIFFGVCMGLFFTCYFCYTMYAEVKKLSKSS